MKKIYIPTMDELYLMQEIGTGYNLYKYLLAKTIEKLIIEWKHDPCSFSLQIYQYLNEDPRIASVICKMYPELIKHSNCAQNDLILCQELITKGTTQDKTIYNLDNLAYFEDSIGIFSNINVLEKTVGLLKEKLPTTPQYRFEYIQNSLLDKIFQRGLTTDDIACHQTTIIDDLLSIEPAYAITMDLEKLATSLNDKSRNVFSRGVNEYTNRYGISKVEGIEYYDQDILTNPNPEVKKLLKTIKKY